MRVHLVGIGGAGMSALANVYLAQGVEVTGSDATHSALLDQLADKGARIAVGHNQANLGSPDLVVRSTAIKDENPELQAARARGIALILRGEAAAQLAKGRRQVVVAGTHGKTTTTTFIAELLEDLDPLVLSGGRLPGSAFNSRPGRGSVAVVEGDESDRSFLDLAPETGVVTNIEADHLDQYDSLREIENAFLDFATLISGALVACVDDPGAARLIGLAPGETVSYGFKPSDVMGIGYKAVDGGSTFDVSTPWGRVEARLQMPGKHNARNALAAVAVGRRFGVSLEALVNGLEQVHLPGRRLELVAEVNGALVYDDYAHHPTEIASTLRAARELAAGRVIAAFQPHLPSRVRALMLDFARSFHDADELVLLPIYNAREEPIPGVSTAVLAAAIHQADPERPVAVLEAAEQLPETLRARLRPGDIAVCMGAGDINKLTHQLSGNVAL